MTLLELMKAARAKIADPAHWARGYSAVNQFGVECDPSAEQACRWCSFGAMEAVVMVADFGLAGASLMDSATEVLRECLPEDNRSVADYNDNHTHAEVLALWDKTIAKLEGR